MKDQKIVLGYVPVMRDTLPVEPAAKLRDQIRARVEEILKEQADVELVAADELLENGMLWDIADVPKLTAYFQEKKVDAMFFPHCNFGQEEPTAMLAKAIVKMQGKCLSFISEPNDQFRYLLYILRFVGRRNNRFCFIIPSFRLMFCPPTSGTEHCQCKPQDKGNAFLHCCFHDCSFPALSQRIWFCFWL